MRRFSFSILDVPLQAEQPLWRRARVFRDGEELPRDRWGNYLLEDSDGQQRRLKSWYSLTQLSPLIVSPDTGDQVVVDPSAGPARVVWFAIMALLPLSLVFRLVLVQLAVIFAMLVVYSRLDRRWSLPVMGVVMLAAVVGHIVYRG